MNRLIPVLLALAFPLAACGGDDGDGSPDSPDASVNDPADAAGPDADPASFCTNLAPSYGALGALTGTAEVAPLDDKDPNGPKVLTLKMAVNADATPDVLFAELYEGEPPFEGGFAPGTYTISGLQADVIACSVCVYLAADFMMGQPIDFHMASSGSVEITSVDPTPDTGSIAGTLTGLSLRQVTVSQQGQMVVPMGCRTSIDSVSFDLQVTAAQ